MTTRTGPRLFACILAGSALLASRPAAAQTQARTLRWDPGLDAAVTFGGAALWIASELLKPEIAPSGCRWCAENGLDGATRGALLWQNPTTADRLSDVTAFLLVPLAALGFDAMAAAHEGVLGNAPEDTLLIAEAGVIAADVNQLSKLLFARERPFVHALPPDEKPLVPHPADSNLSFFSGHAAEAFALAAASGTIGELRGYRWAPVSWGVGGTFALMTGYLRIAADRHWLTDVLVGALVGIGIGVAVPCIFHPAINDAPSISTAAALTTPRSLPPAPPVPSLSFAW